MTPLPTHSIKQVGLEEADYDTNLLSAPSTSDRKSIVDTNFLDDNNTEEEEKNKLSARGPVISPRNMTSPMKSSRKAKNAAGIRASIASIAGLS